MTMVRFVATASVLCACVVGTVASLWLRDEALGGTGPASTPVWTPVTSATEPVVEAVNFTVHRDASTPIPAPAWTGTITTVALAVGDVLDPSSAAPVHVDGVPRPWFSSDIPLYREVGKGAVGADADAVVAYLRAAGFDVEHTAGAALTASTVSAIKVWAEANGFGKNRTAFSTAWVTWLPADQVGRIVTKVEVAPGEQVPSAGADLVLTGGRPSGITPRDPNATLRTPVVAGSADFVEIDGVEYGFAGGTLADDGLDALATALPGDQNEVSLRIVHRFPAGSVTVPASAVVPDGTRSCVVLPDSPSSPPANGQAGTDVPEQRAPSTRTVEVTVLGASAGVVFVAGLDGTQVLANPGSLGVRSCS